VIMAILSTITVGLRFYTRRSIVGLFGYEDWLIGAAYVSLMLAYLLPPHRHDRTRMTDCASRLYSCLP
jgi:hypothetical protein